MSSSSKIHVVKREMTSGRQTISVILIAFGIYIFWMSTAAVFLHGDAVTGVFWNSSPPGSLFPIPYGPGPLMMLTLANPVDSYLFLLLFRYETWIIIEALVILYVVSPYRLARSVVDEESASSGN